MEPPRSRRTAVEPRRTRRPRREPRRSAGASNEPGIGRLNCLGGQSFLRPFQRIPPAARCAYRVEHFSVTSVTSVVPTSSSFASFASFAVLSRSRNFSKNLFLRPSACSALPLAPRDGPARARGLSFRAEPRSGGGEESRSSRKGDCHPERSEGSSLAGRGLSTGISAIPRLRVRSARAPLGMTP
jgi:hypothetical protein